MEPKPGPPKDGIALPTAVSLTVANMIGTGVFTSLGFQLVDLHSGFVVLAVWVVGGVLALCGALSYGELAATLPRSGGELRFLSRLFHPAVGFLAGWVSFTVGFAAPIALAAIAFGRYLVRAVPEVRSAVAASIVLVALVTLSHLRDLRLSSLVQNGLTVFKVLLILVFIGAALTHPAHPEALTFAPAPGDLAAMATPAFAIALLFVLYAYAGWNAAAYVTGEARDPGRTVPRGLLIGTSVVLVLYVGLNAVFLRATPAANLVGQLEVGHVVAFELFGAEGARWMSSLLAIALASSTSAMTWAGPRVTQAMGEDFRFFRRLARTNQAGIPVVAILLQTAIVLTMILTSTFETVLVYVQLVLTASSSLAVAGVFVIRRRGLPSPYRTWGYPVTPLLFLAISVFTMAYTLTTRPWQSLAGVATVLLGLPVYYWTREKPAEEPVV